MLGACTKHIEKARTIAESERWPLSNSGNEVVFVIMEVDWPCSAYTVLACGLEFLQEMLLQCFIHCFALHLQ